jgi:8-oxo-dGTP pyrophosphatase MutT (NUDIX family)
VIELDALLVAYTPADAEEAAHVRAVRTLLASGVDPFARTSFAPGHVTGSAFVVARTTRRVLLHRHRTLDRWLQFGGHDEGERDPLRTAQREAREESGVDGLRLVESVPGGGPILDVDVHRIPARGSEPAHLHHDVRVLLEVDDEAPFAAGALAREGESDELAWLTIDEAAARMDRGAARALAKIR